LFLVEQFQIYLYVTNVIMFIIDKAIFVIPDISCEILRFV